MLKSFKWIHLNYSVKTASPVTEAMKTLLFPEGLDKINGVIARFARNAIRNVGFHLWMHVDRYLLVRMTTEQELHCQLS
jgi:hypothetical protein